MGVAVSQVHDVPRVVLSARGLTKIEGPPVDEQAQRRDLAIWAYALSLAALLDLALYLLAYFFRLRAMSRLAKSEDPAVSIRYFVEEQMVATPPGSGLMQ
jgi:hypothetical protein